MPMVWKPAAMIVSGGMKPKGRLDTMGFFDWIGEVAKPEPAIVKRGVVLRVTRRAFPQNYDHYGIYSGRGNVIHFSRGKIRRSPLSDFVDGSSFWYGNFVDVMGFSSDAMPKLTTEESYQRAKSCLGMTGYDLLNANCEHFAVWCRTGKAVSSQAFGSRSELFHASGALSLSVIRLISELNNRVGLEESRHVGIKGIRDK